MTSMPELSAAARHLVELALAEDVGAGDFTTEWTVPADTRAVAHIVAKQPLVVSGTAVARAAFTAVDRDIGCEARAGDGQAVDVGDVVLALEGPARGLLTGERTALNFLGRLSGIATLTRSFVNAVEGTEARILDTRKTTPGMRGLEKQAVIDGGGLNHRRGLYDMVMVKDNHIEAAGGLEAAVARVKHANQAGLPVEVEVTSVAELIRLLPLGVDRVLLDNMAVETLRECVRRVASHPGARVETEASGNVNLATVRAIAETGVDYVSVGALTHSAAVADLSMRVVG